MEKKIFILMVSAMLSSAGAMAVTPKVVAHRGYWQAAGSAQNSIRSLVKADSVGCYASEFDVWITPDGEMFVNHDAHINGIEIQKTPAAVVAKQKLSNGEYISTLDQYLQAAKNLKIRLVYELKGPDSRAQEEKQIRQTLDLMKKYGLEDRVDYITFSRDAFVDFCNKAPKGTPVYYLTGDFIPEQIEFMKGKGVDYHIGAMRAHPEWIKDCHDRGLEVNVWTVDSPEDMQWCIDNDVDYITTNKPEELAKLIAKNKK